MKRVRVCVSHSREINGLGETARFSLNFAAFLLIHVPMDALCEAAAKRMCVRDSEAAHSSLSSMSPSLIPVGAVVLDALHPMPCAPDSSADVSHVPALSASATPEKMECAASQSPEEKNAAKKPKGWRKRKARELEDTTASDIDCECLSASMVCSLPVIGRVPVAPGDIIIHDVNPSLSLGRLSLMRSSAGTVLCKLVSQRAYMRSLSWHAHVRACVKDTPAEPFLELPVAMTPLNEARDTFLATYRGSLAPLEVMVQGHSMPDELALDFTVQALPVIAALHARGVYLFRHTRATAWAVREQWLNVEVGKCPRRALSLVLADVDSFTAETGADERACIGYFVRDFFYYLLRGGRTQLHTGGAANTKVCRLTSAVRSFISFLTTDKPSIEAIMAHPTVALSQQRAASGVLFEHLGFQSVQPVSAPDLTIANCIAFDLPGAGSVMPACAFAPLFHPTVLTRLAHDARPVEAKGFTLAPNMDGTVRVDCVDQTYANMRPV